MTITRDTFPENRLTMPFGVPNALAVLVIVHAAIVFAAVSITGYAFRPGIAGILGETVVYLFPWFVLIMALRLVVTTALSPQDERPLKVVLQRARAVVGDRDRMLGGVLRFALICLFIGAAGYFKQMITAIQPFAWDESFARLDRAIHMGVDPWRILWPLIGNPHATTFLNAIYHAWFFCLYFAVFAASLARVADATARTFLISLVLTFAVGGNLLALIFSSAGPVYFERLGLGSDFAPLMQALERFAETSPVWALDVQESLWQGFVADGAVSGISAMPSMHVALALLMAFYASASSRLLGGIMWAFAGLTMIGSVHLGWHYAVDGYLSVFIAWGAWAVARRIEAW